jgi:hypothetical protein
MESLTMSPAPKLHRVSLALVLILALAANSSLAQSIQAVKMFVTKNPQTITTGQQSNLNDVTQKQEPAQGNVFVVAVFAGTTNIETRLDHSTVSLRGCDQTFYARTTLLSMANVGLLTSPPPIESLTPVDLGPWGLINGPKLEQEKKYGIGAFKTLQAGKDFQLRYLFQVPEKCTKDAVVQLSMGEFRVRDYAK